MKGQALKGHLDLLLLAVLAEGANHGYAVIEQLRVRSGDVFDLPEGTVYPALTRLERKGLLSSRLVPSTAGPARKYYRTTPAGVDELKRALTDWLALSTNVERVMSSTIDRPSPERSPLTTRR